ncbi:GSCFA domain-containing protein [Eudoraea chungangensis]|uniref:GSCFA domain-containing protein n=1 Tax=Eudoraea chungangensis TaxID=1481905 RepID=UPI0023EE1C15|nr:GSCFA domain-containing protein [Eudoraea chungangensis]
MNLQTQLPLSHAKNKIDYKSELLLLGSCFVENIGLKLNYYQYQSIQNPFGILFHPPGIENLIKRALENNFYGEEDLVFNGESWVCFDAHSQLRSDSKLEIVGQLNQALRTTNTQIKKASHIVITLGTSWVFREKKGDKLVVNCHKMPSNYFERELLNPGLIEESLRHIISLIRKVNKQVSIIFTISPVRHIKNGLVENQRSKAHLITALGAVLEEVAAENIFYFPSYELVMDELRDYRFYANDLIHLNELGIEYIWEKFKFVWIAENTAKIMKEVDHIQKSISHRPFNESSKKHQNFLKVLKEKINAITKDYPFMTFDL